MNATTNRLRIPTSELQLRDIVHEHGMRVLLDTEPLVSSGNNGRTVWAWVGTVQNPDEAVAKFGIPRSFLSDSYYVEGYGWVTAQNNRWNVQGNDLAMWTVERDEAGESR